MFQSNVLFVGTSFVGKCDFLKVHGFFLPLSTHPDLLQQVAVADMFLAGVLELWGQVFSIVLKAEEKCFERPGEVTLSFEASRKMFP